jgi:hypothetical protein
MSDPAPLGPISRRAPELVLAVLGHVYEAEEPVPWLEVVGQFSSDRWPWKTVENTLYDLVAFGALHRIGKPGHTRQPDTRALRPTFLGRAWLDQDLPGLPGSTDHDEEP